MTTRSRRDVPLREVVQPIIEEPLDIARRLDLADWLQGHGEAPRGRWIRQCCSVMDSICPLSQGFGISYGLIASAPWGIVDLTNSPVNQWHKVRPEYWTEIEGAVQSPHFGRIVIGLSGIDGGGWRIGKTSWLPQAQQEGWLESIYLAPVDRSELDAVAEWPASHRQLPIHVNTAGYFPAKIDNGLMRELLSLDGLQGLVLSPTEIAFSCTKRFADLSPNLVYLQLLSLKTAATSLHVLEQLGQLKKLRSLTVGRKLPDDAGLASLARIPHLQTLRLYVDKVTDAGLLQLATLKTLRVLILDLPQVSRAGIYALREARPDLRVIIERDMRDRLGPV